MTDEQRVREWLQANLDADTYGTLERVDMEPCGEYVLVHVNRDPERGEAGTTCCLDLRGPEVQLVTDHLLESEEG